MSVDKSNTIFGSINYKILIAIVLATVAFQTALVYLKDPALSDNIVFVTAIANPLATAMAAWVVARRYKDSAIFGKAYLFLGVAYFSVFLAEVTYFVYEEFLRLEPYPSIADVFFFGLYPFALAHLILNIRFFTPKFSILSKIWLAVFPVSMILVYTVFSFGVFEEPNFDFYYGIIFVSGSAVTMSFAALGAKTFRQGTLGIAWLVLVMGILSNTIGDIWYYYLEVLGEYSLDHAVNLFWYASYWIIIYALYKHKEAI